jgi:hypothetical protein
MVNWTIYPSCYTAVSTAMNAEIKRYGRRPGDNFATSINRSGEITTSFGSTFSAFIYVFWWFFGVSVKKNPRGRSLLRFSRFCVCRFQLIDDLEKHDVDKVLWPLFTNVNILSPAEFCRWWFMFGVKYW